MIDYRITQQRKMEKEGRHFIEEASHDTFATRCRGKRYPPGSTWMWALQAVYGPPAVKEQYVDRRDAA